MTNFDVFKALTESPGDPCLQAELAARVGRYGRVSLGVIGSGTLSQYRGVMEVLEPYGVTLLFVALASMPERAVVTAAPLTPPPEPFARARVEARRAAWS